MEIYLDVLRVIKGGVRKPTRIMYGANLSWKPLQQVLQSLLDQGLIIEIDVSDGGDKRTTKHYEITQKGENVLRYFDRARRLIELEEAVRLP